MRRVCNTSNIALQALVLATLFECNVGTDSQRQNLINSEDEVGTQDGVWQACSACRLVANSIDELIRKPHQMSPYGQVEERIDLEKIKKGVCKNVESDRERERCRDFFFTKLATIERWKQSQTKTSFFDFVCIRELKLCCPRNSFGSKCTRCTECNHNEHCHGEGTRSGNGTCVCRDGHTGSRCASCIRGYYMDGGEEQSAPTRRRKCKACHRSCVSCRQEGANGCEVCKSGYTWVPAYGCSDIDECLQPGKKICGENTFCVNTEGSYFCYECDRACDGCDGDGPDMCIKCARGYKLEKGNCVALKKTILPPEANYYRYAIYFGLGICTCIILHNNVYLASLVGLGVAMYIGLSEYIMSSHLEDKNQILNELAQKKQESAAIRSVELPVESGAKQSAVTKTHSAEIPGDSLSRFT